MASQGVHRARGASVKLRIAQPHQIGMEVALRDVPSTREQRRNCRYAYAHARMSGDHPQKARIFASWSLPALAEVQHAGRAFTICADERTSSLAPRSPSTMMRLVAGMAGGGDDANT